MAKANKKPLRSSAKVMRASKLRKPSQTSGLEVNSDARKTTKALLTSWRSQIDSLKGKHFKSVDEAIDLVAQLTVDSLALENGNMKDRDAMIEFLQLALGTDEGLVQELRATLSIGE